MLCSVNAICLTNKHWLNIWSINYAVANRQLYKNIIPDLNVRTNGVFFRECQFELFVLFCFILPIRATTVVCIGKGFDEREMV